ncbi:MAG TPA: hypothetical protein QGG47_16470 [Acidobacteriota bacterium]|nr:hypothetical protein [Acidobacteriota bacterium]
MIGPSRSDGTVISVRRDRGIGGALTCATAIAKGRSMSNTVLPLSNQ